MQCLLVSEIFWTSPFHDRLFEVVFIDTPTQENLPTLFETIDAYVEDVVCFIYEPLVQARPGC